MLGKLIHLGGSLEAGLQVVEATPPAQDSALSAALQSQQPRPVQPVI